MNELSRQYGTYDKQKALLAMIKDVDSLFRSNGITYSLCGGSLLGAVRENGFIPWDDDIDIMVDRNNYQKIVELFNGLEEESPYRLKRYLWVDRIQHKNDKRHPLYADTIDVFVMDNCPDNVIIRNMKLFLVMIMQGMMKQERDYSKNSIAMNICLDATYIMGLPFSDQRKFKWYQKIAQLGNGKRTEYITGYTDLFKCLRLKYTNKIFDKIESHRFENISLMITAEYDSYLRTQYGDYMTPPKIDRKSVV